MFSHLRGELMLSCVCTGRDSWTGHGPDEPQAAFCVAPAGLRVCDDETLTREDVKKMRRGARCGCAAQCWASSVPST